ncbi:Carboxylesterase type B [Penicillium cf. griseofulvum]|uniref:Carboxylic ester hydrolase n=1 Tax=Penicillium cf. griseofulvum TaxID=2972120 RepID=A0A9W9MS62_9EURO|nr:Carboxylesterase type B [Penicillium cf. griseofulvum]KAJ5440534.1 Carboxylesterase type B [Penicillium cf. griseofulvum]
MVAVLLLTLVSVCLASKLPVVDLGYERHQAISFNSSHGIYNFTNIRYAAPPVGELRFQAPELPKQNREHVQNGSVGRICPQAAPLWSTKVQPAFILSYFYGQSFSGSTNISSYKYKPAELDPRTTEDCLFLDVVVPRKVFERARGDSPESRKNLAPVLVWIYGGGYVGGEKGNLDPTGLIERSMRGNDDGIVYVAMNYRLGAFGWLGGDSINANGTANAALHDQRLALDWVYKNIHLFGGDATRVTVMGESAGAGSILHQITAYGGKRGSVPFQQAILQSPGWVPIIGEEQQEDTLQQFLGILNVSTIELARKLPSDKLIEANAYQVATKSQWGQFTYGPAVDGSFVPALPGQLLFGGGFDHNLNIMVGHNANEGLVFTSPDSVNSTGLAIQMKSLSPNTPKKVSDYVLDVLYPPVYDGSYGYTDSIARTAITISDLIFRCNTDYLNRAFYGETYAYEFSIPPALHGQDVSYTFFNKGAEGIANVTVALAMQDYFTSFVQHGAPKSQLGPVFRRHGKDAQLIGIGNHTIQPIQDPTNSERCRFWQTAPYYRPT